MTTDIQLKVLTSVVEMLEEQHEERGWDNSPTTLYRVCSLDATDPDVLEHLPEDLPEDATVGGFDVQASQLGVLTGLHPRDELAVMANSLDHVDAFTRELFLAGYPSLVITHILISEMWMNVMSTEEKEDFDKQRAGRMLADIPGSVEGRFAMAVLADHVIFLCRTRGKDPEVEMISRNDSSTGASVCALMGGMAESLYKFHDKVVVLLADRA